MGLEIDHLFCFVQPDSGWAERASAAGWILDDGIEHLGQGTRNRRLWLPDLYLEFIWLSSRSDAAGNPLRLDRRADWRTTGACPIGIGLRGPLDDELRPQFWAYEPPWNRGGCILVHETNEKDAGAPFVFVMETDANVATRMRPRDRLADRPHLLAHARSVTVDTVTLHNPFPAQALLARVAPRVVTRVGPPRLEVSLVGPAGTALALTDELSLIG
jgi:hypothetical protein